MTRGVEHKRWARFWADEGGAAMVEFAIVSAVFFLAFFQLLGFGLFASTNLMAEKATQMAARTAVVRPAACAGVPARITSSDLAEPPRFGTNCRAAANTCTAVATVTGWPPRVRGRPVVVIRTPAGRARVPPGS